MSFSTLQSWRRLGVVETHLDLLKHFPSHFRFVLLQHSPDRYVQNWQQPSLPCPLHCPICFCTQLIKRVPNRFWFNFQFVNYIFIMSRSQLFAAYLVPLQPPPPAPKKGQPPPQIGRNFNVLKLCSRELQ